MSNVNGKRVLVGALAGGVAWSVWTSLISMEILNSTYMSEENAGHLLTQPRYGIAAFFASWFLTIFLLSGMGAWL